MIGRKLGPYEVLAKLGEGGMGEVYRARDPRLNRDIALKILPAGARVDVERRERFQREAQVIAALNDPGIVTIYSVEDDDGTAFLTMELVEGRPLSELLARGALPLAQLLKVGIDVADATRGQVTHLPNVPYVAPRQDAAPVGSPSSAVPSAPPNQPGGQM